MLARTGGIAIDLDDARVSTVKMAGDAHPWIVAPRPRRSPSWRP